MIKLTKSYKLLDAFLCSTNKMLFLCKLSKNYSSKSTDDLRTKICQVMNLHRFAPVFTLIPMNEDSPMTLLDKKSYTVQLGPREELPCGLNYIDWGKIIGFCNLPYEILRSK